MSSPMNFAASVTGLPVGKKKAHRGRKPSDKPGAKHLSALQQAHGAGDFKAAKTHALNYAKAAHLFAESDTDDMDAPDSTALADTPGIAVLSIQPNSRAQLAKLAMGRKK